MSWKVNIIGMLVGLIGLSVPLARAADVMKANEYFVQGQYEQALARYQELAELGSAQAFYQLGLMHYQGLGVEADNIKALMWFSLAAEQHYIDAPKITEDLLALASSEQRPAIDKLLAEIKSRYGMVAVQQKYFPVIKPLTGQHNISFVNPDGSEGNAEFLDKHDIEISEALIATALDQESASIDYLLLGRPAPVSIQTRSYFALVDYEIGRDGSVRNPQTQQVNGYIDPALNLLTTSRFAQPTYDDKAVRFFRRAYLGMSGYNRELIRTETFERFYTSLIRRVNKLKASEAMDDQYQYAVALMTFPWLSSDKQEINQVLERLATAGHPLAQFELGALLYRDQLDVAAAFHWLNEASKAGVTKARYWLGRLLLDSPYAERDEHKALFWFEQAATVPYAPALLGAAEVSLLASDPSLHDATTARHYLQQVASTDQRNPEYEYLQAMLFYSQQPRDLAQAVEHLRDAISLGNTFNWDVSDWEKRLNDWTSNGKVLVTDVEDSPKN